ncbi:hypothetical protein B0A69_09980 [Chryseobacterium shigense]|uniref:Uncharacterized protein n=1 Tax=Chryseobacterium shigense TaxID=297244 RepID=A0A1N7IGT9_9FLAO|nr:hypothetical protein [Chryseobacterium shigense]PQA94761.1 hypothetical protein B0A69_09980 [Chryseobacterium shigense]SIS36324.1 hypothetical protein SAMN05421639_103784 [Chryseobacterium shigense]
MNKIILIITAFCMVIVKGQVAIGKGNVVNTSVSLEFASTENRGLVLPYVEDTSGISQNGTLIYDTGDHKVKYLKSGVWFDLSVDTTGTADLSIQTSKTEKTGAKVSIGSPTSTAGILVLEDSNKAMILPKVASPYLNVINPAAGMMVYDTTARQLAIYNGSVWSFWKP